MCISAIVLFVVGLSSYAAHRAGINRAIGAAFQTTLAQLVRMTEETENIKVRIAHSDWTEKELRTLRRSKLEELVTALFTVERIIETHLSDDEISGDRNRRSLEPMSVVEQISTLYFPELTDETGALRIAYLEFQKWRMDHYHAISAANRASKHANEIQRLVLAATLFDEATYEVAKAESQRLFDVLTEKQQEMPVHFEEVFSALALAISNMNKSAATLMASIIKPIHYDHELSR